MNKYYLTIISLFYAMLGFTQNNDIYKVSWLRNDTTYITTKVNAILYQLSCDYLGNNVEFVCRNSTDFTSTNTSYGVMTTPTTRKPLYYMGYKQKKIKKSARIRVRGVANMISQFPYDTYIIEYKNRIYCLPQESVEDNITINTINEAMSYKHETLKSLNIKTLNEYALATQETINTYRDSLNYYLQLRKDLPHIIDSIKKNITLEFETTQSKIFEKWFNSLPRSTQNIYNKTLSISNVSLHSPNSAGGCDCSVYYTNKSSKTIKYLYWTGNFYNAVNDLVYCDVRDQYSFTGKDTGPITPNSTSGGTWDCVIYNWDANSIKLTNISIIYMDGSSVSIGTADIKRLLSEPSITKTNELMGGSNYYLVDKAVKVYEDKLKTIDSDVRKWNERFKSVSRSDFRTYWKERDIKHIRKMEHLQTLESKYKSAEQNLVTFEENNLLR